jgi:hypothetical protein
MYVIGINDGHTIQGPGSGAVGYIIESQHTRLVGTELRALLAQRGLKVIDCTIDYASSQSEALDLIVQKANNNEMDWFISTHFNAGGGRGVEVYTYQGRQYQDALDVCESISSLGFINRGVKNGTGLYVIRKTKAKSMLVEICFTDTEDALHYLNIGYKAVAKAIADALVAHTETPAPVINYQGYVQDIGWQNSVISNSDNYAGTVGQGLRLEALVIQLENLEGNIVFEGYVQNRGWQAPRNSGESIGTIGQELRLEAVKIRLEGDNEYGIEYRTHIQDIGWTDWIANGDICGTLGESRRIEAIQIRLVK